MIYVFLAQGFEEVEALTAVDMLRRCELEVATVGVGDSLIVGSHGIPVVADTIAQEIALDENLQMIVLPGGMPGTLNLEKSPHVQAAVDYCVKENRYIAAICAAPSILGHKGLLNGREAVCYKGFESQLGNVVVSGGAVAVSGNIITGRSCGTSLEFALKLVEILVSKERSDILADALMI